MSRGFRVVSLHLALAGLFLFGLAQPASAAVVLEPGSTVAGKTLPEWSAEWWKWAFSFPVETNPLIDEDGSRAEAGDIGPVFFVAGIFDLADTSVSAARSFRVPAGKYMFFPVLNSVFFVSEPDETLEQAQQYVTDFVENTTELHATIDGVDVPNLSSHRETSPIFEVVMPVNNLFATLGLEAGKYSPTVSDGFWLMVAPLPPGTHSINFGGVSGEFSLDVTANIQAVPEPGNFFLLLVSLAAFGLRRVAARH